ncbi:hypothetical protein AT705_22695 [Pseudoalteromonas rubra]|uniref:Uncharacterized protein n=1 Tax=Pseudoalteromonas rubra TaxID=43658 RepID=A0A0U3ID78_9GAMM|nr:hypothetical protein AT705_22695 [Pseudoalteromonas rubra]
MDQHTSTQLRGAGIRLTNLCQQAPLTGALVKLPAKTKVTLSSTGTEFKAMVIQGSINVLQANTQKSPELRPGSYLAVQDVVKLALSTKAPTLLYVRTNQAFQIARE